MKVFDCEHCSVCTLPKDIFCCLLK